MATHTNRRIKAGGPAGQPQAERPQAVTRDSIDIIPIPVLIIVFLIVEAAVIWLMAPPFFNEFTRWRSLRNQTKGNYVAAASNLKSLVADQPRNPTYLAELGNAQLVLGNYDESIKYFKLAQENRTNLGNSEDDAVRDYPDFNTSIGLGYFRKGDLENAEIHFKKGLEANKQDKTANFHMGEIEFKRGRLLKAVDFFKFVAPDPAYRDRVKDYYGKIEQQLFKGVE
jgi:tetratricopeptide (TPR) repeat protein